MYSLIGSYSHRPRKLHPSRNEDGAALSVAPEAEDIRPISILKFWISEGLS